MNQPHHIATLICNPAAPILDDALIARASALLPGAQAAVWLKPGVAADIAFAGPAGDLAAALGDAPLDIHIGPAANRRKKLFLADMDSTIIQQECIDELADLVGLKQKVSAITEAAMRGEIAFEPALRERVALLKGLKTDVIDRVIAERIRLTPGAQTLVGTMRAHGAYAALVSGGFTPFTSKIAATVGFHENRANRLIEKDGVFIGEVGEPILGANAKLEALQELRAKFGLSVEDVMAAGDGANDIPMLQAAGLGVAFHAKPSVAAATNARVNYGDLTALLYMQGYKESEFSN